jgi:uncharacterized membrane protein
VRAVPPSPRVDPPPAPTRSRPRLDSIDLVRGAVMIVMALDHVRDAFHHLPDGHSVATDLTRTWPALFFTRWITHFCAPVFVFLAGTGARLQALAGKPRGELSRFLVTRGLWLILLELTWIHLTVTLDLRWHWILLQVLWAIGCSMIALAALVWLPVPAIALVGLALCAGHNLLPFLPRSEVALPWQILEAGGRVQLGPDRTLAIGYPLLAWIGVMAAGYAFGDLLALEPARRRRTLAWLGGAMVTLFVALRVIDGYGDPSPWAVQRSALFSLMSFLNCTKYPPSLDYLLMTLGPAILALALLDGARPSRRNPVVVFGRVPLFYYLMHFGLIACGAAVETLLRGRPGALDARDPASAIHHGLPAIYAIWALLVAALYWPCRRYAEYKRAHPERRWLSYL